MGFFAEMKQALDDGRKAGKEGRSYEEVKAEREAKERGEYYDSTVYHPRKEKDNVMQADIYSTYGTHNLDKWFEQGAPHLTDAIYEIRDKISQGASTNSKYTELSKEYAELQGRYQEIKGSYDQLKKQYNSLTRILENLSKEKSR